MLEFVLAFELVVAYAVSLVHYRFSPTFDLLHRLHSEQDSAVEVLLRMAAKPC